MLILDMLQMLLGKCPTSLTQSHPDSKSKTFKYQIIDQSVIQCCCLTLPEMSLMYSKVEEYALSSSSLECILHTGLTFPLDPVRSDFS